LQPELLYSEVAQRFAELFHVPVSIANLSQRQYGEASTSLASMDGTRFVLLWANCDLNDPTLKWSPKRPLLKLHGGQFGIHSKKLVWIRDSGSAVRFLGEHQCTDGERSGFCCWLQDLFRPATLPLLQRFRTTFSKTQQPYCKSIVLNVTQEHSLLVSFRSKILTN
jgi:hypothetical protein